MTIEPSRLAQLAGFALIMASGQLLFKQVSLRNATINDAASALHLAKDPYVWLAFFVYGLGAILWIYLLQRLPLAIAYAFVAVVFAIVPAGAWFFFDERLSWSYAIGTALIMAGVLVIGFRS
jgi:drug/metabolite transporter (DMT)-like permease